MNTTTIDDIIGMYRTWGEERYDEEVTQVAHALQCAALARTEGAEDHLIAAALLHDIGHLFEIERANGPDHRTDLRHESAGAEFLTQLFPEAVTSPVRLHVSAKRYLTATEPDYRSRLSEGSQRSLRAQGGPMTPEECAQFLAIDGSSDAIRLRRWDDHGKVVGLDVPALETWAPLLQRVSVTAD